MILCDLNSTLRLYVRILKLLNEDPSQLTFAEWTLLIAWVLLFLTIIVAGCMVFNKIINSPLPKDEDIWW